MSNRIKTFGQFKITKEGIETVGNCKYVWINREDIMQGNQKPVEDILQLPWVCKSDLKKAYRYAKKYYYQFEKLTKETDPDKYERMMDEYEDLSWKKNKKGNHIAIIELGGFITVFRDNRDPARWKWVTEGVFSYSSYAVLENAKKKAFMYYYLAYCDK